MILLADLVDRYRSDLERIHGQELLPSHHHALNCIRSCRNQRSAVMLLECGDCHHRRADSKFQHGFGSGWRIAISSNAVMSCITACMPALID